MSGEVKTEIEVMVSNATLDRIDYLKEQLKLQARGMVMDIALRYYDAAWCHLNLEGGKIIFEDKEGKQEDVHGKGSGDKI